MKPFQAGWENLSIEDRIKTWINTNKTKLEGRVREYQTLMSNFAISCKTPNIEDYLNFQRDIRFYSPAHQSLLTDGFFEIYNLQPTLPVIKISQKFDPRSN